MVKDTLNSVFDNLKERTTNPFLGTLIVVWLVHNWKLVYSLFYFDSKLTLDERLIYIEAYFLKMPFYINLLLVLVFTILVLCVTYFFLGLSRFISDFYEKGVVPRIVKFNDKSAVVLKSESDKQKEFIRSLEARLEEERLAKSNAQNERDQLDKLLGELKGAKENNYSDDSLYRITANDLRTKSFENHVDEVFENIESNSPINKDNVVIKRFLDEDYISVKQTDRDNRQKALYKLTEEGRNFQDFWLRSGSFDT